MFFGNSNIFAIESEVMTVYPEVDQRALGYFVIYINGNCYGVKKLDASLLACSLDMVRERLLNRGNHVSWITSCHDTNMIADAVYGALYSIERENDFFFGVSRTYLFKSYHLGS
jgi:hypothetical protein